MVKAYPAPKPRHPSLAWVAYLYAAVLCFAAIAALMGLGGFDFAFIAYTTPGLPVMTVILAGLAIFALPFLASLNLSILARFLSALFALTVPLALLAYVIYLTTESLVALDWSVIAGCACLVIMGAISYVALDGRRALRFSKS
ncbi:MAG TPA: hypothetical protein VM581_03950 [Magnetospirillaceae bacterium]|nr:hypothetical protein [Magnetospirillaceae bacterium]